MAGAGLSMDKTRTMVSVQSQANIQSNLDLVSQNHSDYEDMAREPSRLSHELYHVHARGAGHAHLSRINFAVWTLGISIQSRLSQMGYDPDLIWINFECCVGTVLHTTALDLPCP